MRVLENMIKNAIEACPSGKTVKVGTYIKNKQINFHIHNPNFIPKKNTTPDLSKIFLHQKSRQRIRHL
jgi:signal transduction histidine kinase